MNDSLHQCGHVVNISFAFCPGCGEQLNKKLRDESEIKAMLTTVKNYPCPSDVGKAVLMTVIQSTLVICFNWVLGDRASPLKVFEAMEKKQ